MDIRDRLLMVIMGQNGTTMAHNFLIDEGRNGSDFDSILWAARRKSARIFTPPHPEDRVVMFPDKSGVYVFDDGLCTPMGANIEHEIGAWHEDTP